MLDIELGKITFLLQKIIARDDIITNNNDLLQELEKVNIETLNKKEVIDYLGKDWIEEFDTNNDLLRRIIITGNKNQDLLFQVKQNLLYLSNQIEKQRNS